MARLKTIDAVSILSDFEAYKEAKAKPIRKEIARLQELLAHLEGGSTVSKVRHAAPSAEEPPTRTRGRRKRIRRNREQLAAVAKNIEAFVAKSGSKGVTGGDIRRGVEGAALIQQLKAFVEQYGGVKLKTVGQKARMRYFAN